MPRPRLFVNAQGRKTSVNTGVSLHQKPGRFYILDKAGNRTCFGSFDEARACPTIADVRTRPPMAAEIPDDDIWSGPTPDERPFEAIPLEKIDDDHPHRLWMINRQLGIPPTKSVKIPASLTERDTATYRQQNRVTERWVGGMTTRANLLQAGARTNRPLAHLNAAKRAFRSPR